MVLPWFCYAVPWLYKIKQNQEKREAEKVIEADVVLELKKGALQADE